MGKVVYKIVGDSWGIGKVYIVDRSRESVGRESGEGREGRKLAYC